MWLAIMCDQNIGTYPKDERNILNKGILNSEKVGL